MNEPRGFFENKINNFEIVIHHNNMNMDILNFLVLLGYFLRKCRIFYSLRDDNNFSNFKVIIKRE